MSARSGTPVSAVSWWRERSLLPEVQHLSHAVVSRAIPYGYRQQRFPRWYQIDHQRRGSADVWFDDDLLEVAAGEIVVYRPGIAHGGVGGVAHPGEISCVVFGFPVGDSLPGMARATCTALARAFARLPATLPATPAIAESFAIMVAEFARRGSHAELVARGAFHRLLVEVARLGERAAAAPRIQPSSPRMRETLAWIDANLGAIGSLAEVAGFMGTSVPRLRGRFLRELGCTPKAHLLRRRVQRAKRLLAEGRASVLAIALEVGFGSSQHFATTFRRLAGMTPMAYRRLAASRR
jgi:AraC-like DNA-binding protein